VDFPAAINPVMTQICGNDLTHIAYSCGDV